MINSTHQKFLIIGAGGFLGYSLFERFRQISQPAVFVSSSFQWPSPVNLLPSTDFKCVLCDAKDINNYKIYLKDVSTVIYMAGGSNIQLAQNNATSDIHEHISSLLPLFSALKDGTNFIFISSGGAIYGETFDRSTGSRETDILRPKSIYGLRNQVMENLISSYCQYNSIHFSILRLSNPFGIGQFFTKRKGLIMSAILRGISGCELTLRDQGKQYRDFIPIDLFVDYLLNCSSYLQKSDPIISTFNIGLGKSYSTLDVVHLVSKSIGKKIKLNLSDEVLSYEVKESFLDCGLASSNLLKSQPFSLSYYLDKLIFTMKESNLV